MSYQYLKLETRGASAWVWMARADVHNAFDETLVRELTTCLARLDADTTVRAIVLAGEGKSFSAGADLDWMRRQGEAPLDENLADARKLAALFHTLSLCTTPTVARVHGAALGGGMGLAAACDICIASTRAYFATTEVRFGIVPATIAPYVVRAMGERQAHRYFQTAERIDALRAQQIGLVHEVIEPDQLDGRVQEIVDALLAGGPLAQAAATDLVRHVARQPISPALVEETAQRIAVLRASPEAQEGLRAFLEKRAPAWNHTKEPGHV
jgi:methylglutaconyl-CoA hydratase